jgi:hypothetical protein
MQEKLITFETAKSAKEKGFCIELYDFYYQNKSNAKPYVTQGIEYQSDRNCKWDWNLNGGESGTLTKIIPYPNDTSGIYYSAPTQSLLQKWLRETHKIYVLVDMGITRNYHWKYFTDIDSFVYPKGSFKTYEEALEAGLQEALKLIEP